MENEYIPVDFGYGYSKYKEMNYQRVVPESPLYFTNNREIINMDCPLFFIPPAMWYDEIFIDLNPNLIPNTCNRYMVSNYGRIFDKFNSCFLPARFNRKLTSGYLSAHISFIKDDGNWGEKDLYISRAVLGSFNYFPGCENFEADHKNGIHTDNRLCNLEWVTSEENVRRSKENNLCSKAYYANIFRTKITESDAEDICKLHCKGFLYMDISIKLGIDKDVVKAVLFGDTYREITEKYGIISTINIALSDDAVHYICKQLQDGINISNIARDTGVDKLQIKDIQQGKYRKDISSNYDFSKSLKLDGYRKAINDEQAHKICQMLQSKKYTEREIAETLNVSRAVVSNIRSNYNYKDIRSEYDIDRKSPELLSYEQVIAIANDLINCNNLTDSDIAQKYGIGRGIVNRIRKKESYSNYTVGYDFENRVKPTYGVLNFQQVNEICNLIIENKLPQTEIAKMYGVDPAVINGIRTGRNYKDIVSLYIDKFPPVQEHRKPEDLVRLICIDLQNGMRNIDIMKKHNVSKDMVKRIKNRSYYQDISKDYVWDKPDSKTIDDDTIIAVYKDFKYNNMSKEDIAKKYNIHVQSVYNIVTGKTRSNITSNI